MQGQYIMRSFSATLAFIALIHVTTVKTTVFTEDQEARIQEYIDSVLRCRNIPGLTLSVVKGDGTWARGYGMADLGTGRRVDNNTVFLIGSLGKAFTMTLLGSFLQENGFDWNTKLSELPNASFQFVDEERTRELTIADLLSHRTGLSPVTDYGFIAGYPDGTTQQAMSGRLKYVPASREMRESFIYNNLMYMVLGHVTETLGVDSWENLMTSYLLEPIGMGDTRILKTSREVLRDDYAKPYMFKDGEMQAGTEGIYKLTPLEPAGSIVSTGLDMATWMRFNMNNATSNGGENLLEPEMFQQAFQEQMALSIFTSSVYSIKTPTFPVNDITSGYGYAWFKSSYRGHRKVWHSGGLFSYVSLIWLYPDQNIGIFASTNGPALPSTGTALNTIFYYISDLLLGFEPWIDPVTACSFPSPWRNTTTFAIPPQKEYTNDNMAEFVGTYGSHLLPDVTISMDPQSSQNGRLRFDMNRIKGFLSPTESNNTFGFQMSDPWEYAIERVFNENFTIRYPVEFVRSTGNDVIGFNITFESTAIIPFRKDIRFQDGLRASASTLGFSWLVILAISSVSMF